MKRTISTLFACLLAVGLLACSKQGPDTAAAPEASAAPAAVAEATVGLSISTLNNPFFVALRDGAQAEATAQGVKLIAVDAQDDPAKQIASVEDLIQKKVQVILINPTDSDAVANVVKQATAAGIKVISLDRSVNGAEVSAHIASDNVAGGKMAAEFLLEKIGGKGNVVELEGIAGSSAARERGQGFHSVVDGKADVKLVAKQPADFDRAKGLSVMENILQGNKNVQGVFAHNDEMALGAQKAIEAAGLKNVVIVGFDATPDAVAAVKAGTLAATVQQKPELIGKMGVEAAKKLIDGAPVDKSIPVPLDLVKQ
ncbi:ribose ABC transporter substrate-binding protein RbsB [Chitinolyticbacter meiyuanensis]|uniref:ribose ABC transporter substrate-binding protein RbsB n=1 Tax=Chitinolyticbacter meiyuanensis TaxID=682798 RepID=UPI0011E5A72D|nr:ribose ABC transporter substrate-binding protein RbsB [Chitinolyticbacter meiyuanensis]